MKTNSFSLFVIIILALIISVAILEPAWQIGGDGFGYYSYVRSFIFDRNFNLQNEFALFDSLYNHTTLQGWQTSVGQIGNPFAIGSAVLWTPFVFIAFLLTKIFSFYDPYSIIGFNGPYQLAVVFGTWFYTLFGIILIFKTLSKIIANKYAWWSSLIIFGISPLPFYLLYEPSMAHGPTVFSSGLFFYIVFKIYKSDQINFKYYLFLGLSTALLFFIRWQDIVFAFIPLVVICYKIYQQRDYKKYIKPACLALVFFVLGILPQLFMWHHLFGQWIAVPQGSSFFHLTQPHFFEFLFSSYHGMFIIHPLLILSILGLFIAYKKQKLLTILLSLTLILQIYLNSGLYDWYGGGSFGARRMVSSVFILIFGLAFLLKKYNKQKLIMFLLSFIILIAMIFNGLLMISYARQIIPLNAPTSYTDIYTAPLKVFHKGY